MAARLMLVDDDQNILASVSVALEAEGFEVSTCLLYTSPSPRDS